jgi:hypothetical protein
MTVAAAARFHCRKPVRVTAAAEQSAPAQLREYVPRVATGMAVHGDAALTVA